MLDVLYKDDIYILKEKGNSEEIQKNVEYYDLKAPIQKGKEVGGARIELQF